MSIRDRTQNRILRAGAEARGHVFVEGKTDGFNLPFGPACSKCGDFLFVICEKAMDRVESDESPSICVPTRIMGCR